MLGPSGLRTIVHRPWHQLRRGLALPALLALTLAAQAHLMPAQQGTLNVVGDSVFVVLSLPLSAFEGIDEDGDGRLSAREMGQQQQHLRTELASRLQLTDGGAPGRIDLLNLMAEPHEKDPTNPAGADHFLLMGKWRFAQAPQSLHLRFDVFGQRPAERQMTIRASRGPQEEAAVLTPVRQAHDFFQAPTAVALNYTRIGIEHILLGADHLLFVCGLLLAGRGWKFWLWTLSAFTLAHSLTLGLGLFGIVRVPPTWTEPAIAASIAALGLAHLRASALPRQALALLVLGCGLLHGLGFATALADMGLHGVHQWASLLGFNVGIELGQIAFVAVLLVVGRAAQRLLQRRPQASFRPTRHHAAWGLLAIGVVWTLERLLAS